MGNRPIEAGLPADVQERVRIYMDLKAEERRDLFIKLAMELHELKEAREDGNCIPTIKQD